MNICVYYNIRYMETEKKSYVFPYYFIHIYIIIHENINFNVFAYQMYSYTVIGNKQEKK